MSQFQSRVRGRFAPSPTGPLHPGSLVAAAASYLSARSQGGEWLVRMEDLDPPREVKGAADDILRTLEAFGFEWDGPVMYQSRRADAYEAALAALARDGYLYACGCSRREIADSSVRGIEGPVYPGTCRSGLVGGREARALRVRTEGAVVEFVDRIQGPQACDLAVEVGDFVLKRADGQFAYQLAVVVDDAAQGVTEIVRGADLLHSSARQIHVRRLLGYAEVSHAHVPAIVNARGQKLSKQTGARPLSATRPAEELRQALTVLGAWPKELDLDSPRSAVWSQAIANWSERGVPGLLQVVQST